MKMKVTGLWTAVFGLLAGVALAAPTTADDAKLVAAGWTATNATFGKLGAVKSVATEKDANGSTLWYVVTMEKGAAVVAPDTEIEPIIAVLPGSNGEIPAASPLRAMLLRDLPQRLAMATATQATTPAGGLKLATAPSKTAAKWAKYAARGETGGSRLKLLDGDGNPATIVRWLDGWNSPDTEDGVQTLRFWDQDFSAFYFSNWDEEAEAFSPIFNLYTPNNYYCGCVATAGASVMHYFRVPEGAVYTNAACQVDGVTRRLVTQGGVYDWSLIDGVSLRRGVPVNLSEAAIDLLGRVAYDCGVGSAMMYGEDGSGAYSCKLVESFRKVFKLKNAQLVTATGGDYGGGAAMDVGPENYAKIIYNQIRAGAPVVLGIDGHEVVATGYGYDEDLTDYAYVFLGWGGGNDAWYALPEVNTKATAEGGWYTSTFIDELITEISPDEKFVAVVGRLLDRNGQPTAGRLSLSDGTPVIADAKGYWGVRIDPMGAREIVDPTGEGHLVRIGGLAEKTTTRGVAATALAQALPEEMELTVDTESTDYLRIYKDLAAAQRTAIASGKLLYLVGGTDEEALAILKAEMRASGDYTDYVVCQIDSETCPQLIGEPTQGAAFDPRVFDSAGAWDEDNGLWEDPASWEGTAHGPVGLTLVGPKYISTLNIKTYTYQAVVDYADGVSSVASPAICSWGLSGTKGIILTHADGNYKTDNKKVTGTITVSVEVGPVFGTVLSGSLEVVAANKKVAVPGATKENGYLLTSSSSDLAKAYARQIATAAFVTPMLATTKTPGTLTGDPGTTLYACVRPTCEVANAAKTEKYLFAVTGYELYKDGVLVETGTREDLLPRVVPGEKDGVKLELPVTLDTGDIVLKWKWEEANIWVQMVGNHNVGIDKEPQYVVAGDKLVVTATPPGGENLTTGYFVWQGAFPREITGDDQAALLADKPREVIVDWVRAGSTFTSARPATDFTMKPGYCVEEVGVAEDGSYILQVVEAQVDESEAKVRVLSLATGETTYYAQLGHAFADIRGASTVEILDDLPLTGNVRVYESVTLRTAADAAVPTGTITREGGLFLVDVAAALAVENVTVVDAHAAEGDETPVMQPLFEVTGGTLTLKDGARIADLVTVSNAYAAAVYVHQAGGFAMEPGSAIENCANRTVREEWRVPVENGWAHNPSNLTFSVASGLAGGVILAEGSSADLRGGRIAGCEGGTGGGVAVLDRSTLEVSDGFVATGNTGHETVYEFTTGVAEVEVPPEDGEEVDEFDPPRTIMVEYDYVSGSHDVTVDRNLRTADPRSCTLAAPLTGEASVGRFTSEQTDTNLVACVTAWASWDRTALTNSAARIFSDADPSVFGLVVTNASTTALVVWSTAVREGVFAAANGEVYGVLAEDQRTVTPEPIAFTKIELNEDRTEVTLAFTNAVQWCNYAIYGTDTLENGFSLEGLDPVTNFQWQVTEPTAELTLPTNGNLFWKATADDGLVP